MSEPTTPEPPESNNPDHEPSGFDPREYEDEIGRLQELPPRQRMYLEVKQLALSTFEKVKPRLEQPTYSGSLLIQGPHFNVNYTPSKTDPDFIIYHYFAGLGRGSSYKNPVPEIQLPSVGVDKVQFFGLTIVLNSESRLDKELIKPYLQQELRQGTLVIDCALISYETTHYHHPDDIEAYQDINNLPANYSSHYAIVLQPEAEPVMIQLRPGDVTNNTLTKKLAHYPNHKLSDQECKAIMVGLGKVSSV